MAGRVAKPGDEMERLWFETALLPGGWADAIAIAVADGLIASVTVGAEPGAADERHAVALPGLPNLHSHAFQRGMAGLTERRGASADSFWTWRETMYRFVDAIEPDDVEAIAALAYVEMLEAGFTRVGEFHYLHHAPDGSPYADPAELAGRIGAAAAETGIALTLLPVFYAHGGVGGAAASPGQRRFLGDRDGYARLVDGSRRVVAGLPDAVLGLAPHSLRAATPNEIAAILPLAEGPVHIHVAEQVREVEECVAWSSRRPVELLLDECSVDERWCLIHATHVTPAEVEGIVRSGAAVGLCPLTEASLGDGIFPADAFVAAGGRFGIGSDSNVLVDAAGELRMLESVQRLHLRARNVLASGAGASTGRTLFDRALAGGSQALGVAGGLAPGRPADLVSLDGASPTLCGRSGDAILDSWIFAGSRALVDCVWRRGEKLVAGGRHRARETVERCYVDTLRRLLAS